MSKLQLKGEVEILGKEVPEIAGGFGENKRSMLAKDIADFHDKKLKHVNEAICNNITRFRFGVDLVNLNNKDFLVELVDHDILTQNSVNRSSNIFLLSERGYAKLIKIFDDDLSWEMYDKLLDNYFEMREEKQVKANANQFDILRSMVDQMEEMDKRTRRAEEKSVNAEQQALEANKNVEKIKNTFAQIDDDWRQYVNKVFSKIGRKTGDYRSYRKESYIMLDRRARVDLQQRLRNKKKRMKENGATKTAIKEANKLDVIEDSKKLIEIYINIVQEFEAKHLNQEAS